MTGPILIAATAIAAAWIAARTANRRQQVQLEHDRELQKAQLEHDRELRMAQLLHDRELQDVQLAYDREQRNRQHVRDAIDSAVRCLYAAVRQLAEYQGLIFTGDETRDAYRRTMEDEALPDAEREAAVRSYEQAMDKIGAATLRCFDLSGELMAEGLRLSLRLGVGHPICESHSAYDNAYGASFEILRDLPTVKISDKTREQFKIADASEGEAMQEFLSSCRRWFEEEQRKVGKRGPAIDSGARTQAQS